MKNLVIVALSSALLFSVSAGLSIWLQQSKLDSAAAETAKDKDAKKADKPEKLDKTEKHDKDSHGETKLEKPAKPTSDPLPLSVGLKDQSAAVKEREDKLAKQKDQVSIILQDMREVQTAYDALAAKVASEAKAATALVSDLDSRATELDKQKSTLEKKSNELNQQKAEFEKKAGEIKKADTPDPAEAKNIEKLATMYDTMPAETAAKILQQMADSGKMDTAVKVLGRMKERQAAKILAELPDAGLASQLPEKIRLMKRAEPTK